MNAAAVNAIVRARVIARRERDRQQVCLLEDNDLFAQTIYKKLEGLCSSNQFWNFGRCGQEQVYRTCRDCGELEKFTYQCNLKWCPRCQWRVVEKRKALLKLWTAKLDQPKHLVLTQKNFPILTRKKLREHMGMLSALRRRKIFGGVDGGCVSTEITNEGRGWHLHSHWLLNVRFIPIERLAVVWGEMVGQSFAVVRIMDVRDASYIQEVCKYVCDGSEMAKWPAEQINEFVTAVRGTRFFASFGKLRKLAPLIRQELAAMKPAPKVCDCGCEDFRYESEVMTVVNEVRAMERSGRLGKPNRQPRKVLLPAPDSVTVGTEDFKIAREELAEIERLSVNRTQAVVRPAIRKLQMKLVSPAVAATLAAIHGKLDDV